MTASVSVLVCRGCCCGTAAKHSDVDHDAQLDTLRAALPDGGRLWTVDCVGPCESSNVVVVRRGTRRRWFGGVLTERTTAAIATWIGSGAPDEMAPALAELVFDPDTPTIELEPADLDAADLTRVIVDAVRRRAGNWSIGVVGALAEWVPDDATAVRQPSPNVVEATNRAGALRLIVDALTRPYLARRADGTVGMLLLFTPRRRVRAVVTHLGPDVDAIEPSARRQRLVDLGLGVGSLMFAVRSADERLLDVLGGHAGGRWTDLLDRHGPDLVAASPTRVVASGAGRIEVDTPIPPPGGRSPDGSHTHLLPAELQLGRELPVGLTVPAGLAVGATFHPHPGWAP